MYFKTTNFTSIYVLYIYTVYLDGQYDVTKDKMTPMLVTSLRSF